MSLPQPKHSFPALLSLIVAGEAIFFLPFVIPRVFRPTLLQAFDITNLELGTAFSVYGIVAMVSYFFGGPLADKYPARNLMAVALWLTGLGGFALMYFNDSSSLIYLYGYWGFTSIFLFWAAMIKATREWGGRDLQGRAFGFLEGGRGAVAALLGSLALGIFSFFYSANDSSVMQGASFNKVLLMASTFVMLAGVLVWLFIPGRQTKNRSDLTIDLKKIKQLIAMPTVWLQALMIVCAYVGYKCTDDFSLYANEVLGMDEVQSAGVGSIMLWMRAVFAVMAGFLADRYAGSKIIIGCFAFMLLGALGIASGWFDHSLILSGIVMTSTVIGVYGVRGIYFAVMQEASIPLHATGTAVGIMSVIGYTPDVFMSPLMGYLLDNHPGVLGHQYLFGVLVGFSLVGLGASWFFKQKTSAHL